MRSQHVPIGWRQEQQEEEEEEEKEEREEEKASKITTALTQDVMKYIYDFICVNKGDFPNASLTALTDTL